MAEVQTILTKFEVDISGLKNELRQLQADFKASQKAGQQSAEKVEQSEKELGAEVKKVTDSVQKQGSEFTKTGKQGNSAVDGLTKNLKKVAGAVGIAFGISEVLNFTKSIIQLTSRIEENFSQIENLVGVTGASLEELRQGVEAVSITTGQTQEDLSAALFAITSAGLRGAEALEVLEQSAKASVVGLGDARDIALATGAVIQAYGAENISASEATDILTATIREGNLEASSFAPVIGRVVGLAAQLGVGFDELGANVATYTRLGVSAEQATTGLEGILRAINKPTDDAKKALGEVGLTFDELRAKIREQGLAASLVELTQSFGDNTEALGRVIPESTAFANVLGTASAQGEQYVRIANSIANSTGILDGAYDSASKTLANQYAQSVALINSQLIKLGEETSGPLNNLLVVFNEFARQLFNVEERTGTVGEAAQVVSDIFQGFRERVNRLIGLFKAFVEVGTNIAKTLGLVSEETSSSSAAINFLGKTFDTVEKIGNKFIRVIFRILGVFNGFTNAVRTGAKEITELFNAVAQTVDLVSQGKFKQAIDASKNISFDFGNIADSFNQGFQDIVKLNDPKIREQAKKSGEELGSESGQATGEALGDGLVDALSKSISPAVAQEVNKALEQTRQESLRFLAELQNDIRESQKILQEQEFKLKFGVSPEVADEIDATIAELTANLERAAQENEFFQKFGVLPSQIDEANEKLLQGIEDQSEAEQEKERAKQEVIRSTNEIFAALQEVTQGNAAAQKAIALAQIAINQGLALSNAIAQGAAAGPPPANLIAIATGVAAVVSAFAQVFSVLRSGPAVAEGFAVGTADAPGGMAWVGEKGPEIMHVPKGARIFTAEASKRERPLIEALNRGDVEDYIRDVYVAPALMEASVAPQVIQNTTSNMTFDDFQLRQAIRSNKVIELGDNTISKLKPRTLKRLR